MLRAIDFILSKTFQVRDGFYFDLVVDFKKHMLNAWIWHEDYGVKSYMFGVDYKEDNNSYYSEYTQFIELVYNSIESDINAYKKEYMEDYSNVIY